MSGARAAFGGGGDREAMPTSVLSPVKFRTGYNVADLFTDTGLVPSKSEARRLVQQGCAFVSLGGGGLQPVTDVASLITAGDLDASGELLLRAGKKRYCRVITG